MPQNPLEPNEFNDSGAWTHPSQLPRSPRSAGARIRSGLVATGVAVLGGAALAVVLTTLITPSEGRRVVTSTLAGLSSPAGAIDSDVVDQSTQLGIIKIEVINAEGTSLGIGLYLGDNKILANASLINNAQIIHCYEIGLNPYQKNSAVLVGTDPMSDIAVLDVPKIDSVVARLGSANSLQIGTKVTGVSVGDNGIIQLSEGQVRVVNELATSAEGKIMLGMITTDLATSGPMIDSTGLITGFLTLSAPGRALPIDDVRIIVAQIISFGRAQHGWIGLEVRDGDARDQRGVVVVDIKIGSPGFEAGLEPGDRITAFDSESIDSHNQLLAAITRRRAGDPVVIEIVRGGIRKELSLSLADRPTVLAAGDRHA